MSMPGWQASQARRSQNCEVIGPLTGQMRLPLPCLIGPAGSVPCDCCSVAWILDCSAFRPERLPSSCLRSARTVPRACALSARVPARPTLRVDEALLGAGDLVAALLDDRGELLLAALEDVQALGGRRRVGLGGAHDLDDVLVLLGHALHELAALEQLGEALGGHDHRDDVGRVGLVELDEALGERGAGLGQAGAQAHEAPALGAQVALGLEELVALGVEVGLGVGLLALQGADAALQAADALRVGADLRGQQALGALALADLALRDPDLALDVAQAPGRRRSALGEDRQRQPRARAAGPHPRAGREDACGGACYERYRTRVNLRYTVMSRACGVSCRARARTRYRAALRPGFAPWVSWVPRSPARCRGFGVASLPAARDSDEL